MKRKVLAGIIGAVGVVGMAMSSYGQGQIVFNTYNSTGYFPVVYGAGTGALQGQGAGVNVDAELGYFIGTATVGSTFTLLPTSITSIAPSTSASAPANGQVGQASVGYILGPAETITGYAS